MPARLPSVAVLAAAALVAAGCTSTGSSGNSSKSFQGDQAQVAKTIDDLSTAASKRQQDTICANLLAKDLVSRLDGRGGCGKVVLAALKDSDTSDVAADSITINGTTAQAKVKSKIGKGDRFSTYQLVQQDGRWKISSFG